MATWTCDPSGVLMHPAGGLGCTNEAIKVIGGSSSLGPLMLFIAVVFIHQLYMKGETEWPIDVDVMEEEE